MGTVGTSPRWLVPLVGVALAVGLVPAASLAGPASLIAFESNRSGTYQIWVMNADGSSQKHLTGKSSSDGQNLDPAWSPGQNALVFESDRITGKYSDLWVMNRDGSNPRRLTALGGPTRNPAWSPDGKKIAFQYSKNATGPYAIYVMAAPPSTGPVSLVTPTRGATRLTDPRNDSSLPAWSKGNKIAFAFKGSIYVMKADGTGKKSLTPAPARDTNPAWSPDGTRIAFGSDRSGSSQIWVMSSKGGTQTQLTGKSPSDGQNFHPSWSRDGKTIVFDSNRDGNIQIYSMSSSGSNPKRLTKNSALDLTPNF